MRSRVGVVSELSATDHQHPDAAEGQYHSHYRVHHGIPPVGAFDVDRSARDGDHQQWIDDQERAEQDVDEREGEGRREPARPQ